MSALLPLPKEMPVFEPHSTRYKNLHASLSKLYTSTSSPRQKLLFNRQRKPAHSGPTSFLSAPLERIKAKVKMLPPVRVAPRAETVARVETELAQGDTARSSCETSRSRPHLNIEMDAWIQSLIDPNAHNSERVKTKAGDHQERFQNSSNWSESDLEDPAAVVERERLAQTVASILAVRRIRRYLFRTANNKDKKDLSRKEGQSHAPSYRRKGKYSPFWLKGFSEKPVKPKANTIDILRRLFGGYPRFSEHRVKDILQRRCAVMLGGLNFETTRTLPMVKVLCADLLDNVKLALRSLPRHRVVINVVVVQSREQAVTFASRCLWNSEEDSFCSQHVKIADMWVIVCVHWVKKE